MKYLANAFSLQMRGEDVKTGMVKFEIDLTPEMVGDLSQYESYIGHQDTANVLGVPMHRGSLILHEGDRLVVAQLTGKDGKPYRLPEGTTTMPEDAEFHYIGVFYINVLQVAAFYNIFLYDFFRNCGGRRLLEKFLWEYAYGRILILKEYENVVIFKIDDVKYKFTHQYISTGIGYDDGYEYIICREDGTEVLHAEAVYTA